MLNSAINQIRRIVFTQTPITITETPDCIKYSGNMQTFLSDYRELRLRETSRTPTNNIETTLIGNRLIIKNNRYIPQMEAIDEEEISSIKLEASDEEDDISVDSLTEINSLDEEDERWAKNLQRNSIIIKHKNIRKEIKKTEKELIPHLHFLKAPSLSWINSKRRNTTMTFDTKAHFVRFLIKNQIISPPQWLHDGPDDRLAPTPQKENPFVTSPDKFTLGKRSAKFNSPPEGVTPQKVLQLEEEVDCLRYENLLIQHNFEEDLKHQDFEIRCLRQDLKEKEDYIASAQATFNRSFEEEIKEAEFKLQCAEETIKEQRRANLEKADTIARTQRLLNEARTEIHDMRERHEFVVLRQDAAIVNLTNEKEELEANLQEAQIELAEAQAMGMHLENEIFNPNNRFELARRLLPGLLTQGVDERLASEFSVTHLKNLTAATTNFVYQLNGLCHNIEEDELANKNRILDFMREAPAGTCFFFQPEWSPNPALKHNPTTGEMQNPHNDEELWRERAGFEPVNTSFRRKLWLSDLLMRRVFNREDPLNYPDNEIRFGGDPEEYDRQLRRSMRISGSNKLYHLSDDRGIEFRQYLADHQEFINNIGNQVHVEREDEVIRSAISATLVNAAWPWMSFNDCANLIMKTFEGQMAAEGVIPEEEMQGESVTWQMINPAFRNKTTRDVYRRGLPAVRTRTILGVAEPIEVAGIITICYEKLAVGWKTHTWRWDFRRFDDQVSRLGEESFAGHRIVN